MQLVLVNRFGGISLTRNGEFRLNDHPDRTIAVYLVQSATKQNNNTTDVFPFENNIENLDLSLRLFWMGKPQIIAEFCKTDLDIWGHSRDMKSHLTVLQLDNFSKYRKLYCCHPLHYRIYPAIRWGFCPSRMTSNN